MCDKHRSVAFPTPFWFDSWPGHIPGSSIHTNQGRTNPSLMKGFQMSRREDCLIEATPVAGEQPDSCGAALPHRGPSTSPRLQEWF